MFASITSFVQSVVNFHHGNFTPTVIVWTVMGLVGTAITLFNLRDAVLDTQALVGMPAETTEERKRELITLAMASVRQEVVRLVQMLTVTSVGVVVAFSTPVVTDEQRKLLHIPYWTPTGITLTLALLGIVGLVVVQAALDRRLRKLFYSRRKP